MRVTKVLQYAGLSAFIIVGGLSGCSGGSETSPIGVGGGNNQVTGEVTAENVQFILQDLGESFGVRDFGDFTFLLDEANNEENALKANSNKSTGKTGQEADTFGTCPVIKDNETPDGPDANPYIATVRFNSCTPSDSTTPANGSVVFRETVSDNDQRGNPTNLVQDYTFNNLELDEENYNGRIINTVQGPSNSNGDFDAKKQIFDFRNFKVGDATFNGKETTDFIGASQGHTVQDLLFKDPDFSVQFNVDIKFQVLPPHNTTGDPDYDLKFNGTSGLKYSDLGSYNLQFKDVVARDACDSSDSGTLVIKGANGEGIVTFGPGCGKARLSINGGPAVAFDMVKFAQDKKRKNSVAGTLKK